LAEVALAGSATGKRKTAVARVRLQLGTGNILVNGRAFDEFFTRESLRILVRQPLEATNLGGRYDVVAKLHGGGMTGQAGALRHGIARALEKTDPNLRQTLKRAGFLTRDARKKERKKYGLRGARARFQFSKRSHFGGPRGGRARRDHSFARLWLAARAFGACAGPPAPPVAAGSEPAARLGWAPWSRRSSSTGTWGPWGCASTSCWQRGRTWSC
jgi:small subunit ribosomal protein S9